MSNTSPRWLAIVLGLVGAVCLLGWVWSFCSHGWLLLQTMFADEQTQLFDEMQTRALQSTSPRDIAEFLEAVVAYYPSGTKQQPGSPLDRVVERHRSTVVRDIVAHLRRTTGEDLGESAEPWMRKY